VSDLGWSPCLIITGLLFIALCGLVLYLEERKERNQLLPPPRPDSRRDAFRDFK